jgi:ABC-type spermidine/putrescine transport system permease subunit I
MAAAETRFVGEKGWFWPALAGPGVLWLVLLFLTPFYALFAVAMGRLDPLFNSAEPVWNPLQWNAAVFGDVLGEVFGGRYGPIFLRTIAYVALASLISLTIGYPVAYFVARHAGRWRTLLLVLIVAPFWINYLMRMMAWINLLAPEGQVNSLLMTVGILDEPRQWLVGESSTVILGLVYGYVPFLILPLFAALDRMDKRVVEAARDLGASPAKAFWRVTLPLSRQGVMAGIVVIMLPMFGDYYTTTLMANSPRTRMIGNEIADFIDSGAGGQTGAALTIVLMAFVAVLMTYYLVSVARAAREAGP